MREATVVPPDPAGSDDPDRLNGRLAETFARDTPNPAVCVADGFGVRVGVVVLDPFSGELHLTSGGTANNDPRLRRAQALAMATAEGMEATRYLIACKLVGQASVAQGRLANRSAADTIARLREVLQATETLEEIRHLEAIAANVYWNAWGNVDVPFVRKDVARVPDHWRSFEGRRSAVNVGTARSATDPANALLNYGYRLLEAEGRLACLTVGLDPGLGILHADMKGRDSMVLDLMEAGRPIVDGFVLDLLASRPLMKSDFAEDRRGVLRVLPPISHRIAEAMPIWARALGPVVQHVAGLISSASPYDVSVPSVLVSKRHREVARNGAGSALSARPSVAGPNPGGVAPRAKARQRPTLTNRSPVPIAVCRGCGAGLRPEADRDRPRTLWCDPCLSAERGAIDARMLEASRESAERHRAETGVLPSHTDEAQRRRRVANRRQRLEQLAAANEDAAIMRDAAWYEEHIAPKLADLSLTEIAVAIGVSTSAASKFRRGLRVPSPRHWAALADLAGTL